MSLSTNARLWLKEVGIFLAVGLALGAGYYLLVYGWPFRTTATVGYTILFDEDTIRVGSGCGSNVGATADETDHTVTIRIRMSVRPNADCGSEVDVNLRSPLGERTVIDFKTGLEVEVWGRDPIESAKEEWDRLGVDNYRITYSVHNLNGVDGSPGDGVYTVVVFEGKVTECTLAPGRRGDNTECLQTTFGYGQLPSDVLFNWVDLFEPGYTVVRYHPDVFLPILINYDRPTVADEEYEIKLIEFIEATAP